MANTVTIRKLIDGPRHLIVHVDIIADGSGELSAVTLVDPNGSGAGDPVPTLGAKAVFTVEEIWYDCNPFWGYLQFDGATKTGIWNTNDQGANHVDFRSFGGIKDVTSSTPTGKVLFTSVGVSATAGHGTLVLKLRKD